MRTIYVDSEFKCHLSAGENRAAVETDFFDGKCDAFVEGHRLIPPGETWTRSDGVVFREGMIAPWEDNRKLEEAQRTYEQERLADAENALAILLGGETT